MCVRVRVGGWVDVNAQALACACLLIQYATRRRHVCVLSGSTIYFDVVS
jgi:hypothetical protein